MQGIAAMKMVASRSQGVKGKEKILYTIWNQEEDKLRKQQGAVKRSEWEAV
jgi:hypothetical protein